MTYADIRNAISLQGSAVGPWLYVLPDGRRTDEFGLAAALASLSARQVAAMGLQISGISGRPGSISSKSADLTASLASRLQQRLGTSGLILFKQTWKAKVTASGQSYWAHTASAPRTSDSGFGSWPTPRANDSEKRGQVADDPRNGLVTAANLASWVTQSARDLEDSPGMATTARKPNGSKRSRIDQLPRQASGVLANGCTAETAKHGQLNPAHSRWLMGFPPEWDACAPTETQSSRKSRQK